MGHPIRGRGNRAWPASSPPTRISLRAFEFRLDGRRPPESAEGVVAHVWRQKCVSAAPDRPVWCQKSAESAPARAVNSLRPPRDGLTRRAVGGEGGAKAYQGEEGVGSPRRELTRLLDGERRVEGQPPQTNDVRQRRHRGARARDHPETQNRCDRA